MASKSIPSSRPRPPPARSPWLVLFLWLSGAAATLATIGTLLMAYMLIVMLPKLPSLEALTDYQPKVPLRVYTADHVLIGEFGAERRHPMRFEEIPEVMKKAVLAIEDFRFYDHHGVDFISIVRAGLADILHGSAAQGASTITMQVARNFFLSSEKTYTRKLYEMLVAYRIEATLTKDQILEVYMNQIFLGQRAYGFAAAARVYFGKDLKDITVAEAAMLAGLPKAPSAYNPIVNPKRAKIRQTYILKRMHDLRYIDAAQYQTALQEILRVKGSGKEFSVHAEYVAETVRQMMYAQYQDEIYTRGLNVVTTIDSAEQDAAYRAVRKGVLTYERRQGYRGPETYIDLPAEPEARDQAIANALLNEPDNGELKAAVVITVRTKEVQAELLSGDTITITGEGLAFAERALTAQAPNTKRIKPGAVIRVTQAANANWSITQLPQLEGALISLTPQNGAIRALVGGFDFNKNKFNHVTQAWRQPGSSFKPFIYAASLEKGLGPATIINDAPLYFPATQTGGQPWEPKNYGGRYEGPISLRTALAKSKNLVSIRILDYIGPKYAQEYLTRFGFDADKHPAYLPMALGAGLVTPLQMATGYAVFANGGYHVNPYLIATVTDQRGIVISQAQPLVAERNAPRTISARNAYLMTNLLHSAVQRGTGARSNVLRRADLAGKTGTTNDSHDAWFAGFQHELVAISWLGYDHPKSLGDRETGSGLALPMWIDYMSRALPRLAVYSWPRPSSGITEIDGELFYDDFLPGQGFITHIDTSQSLLTGEGGTISGTNIGVSETEKQDIMDLFKGQ